MVSMTTDSVVTEAMDGARDIVPTIQKRQENVFQYNLHLWERDCACGKCSIVNIHLLPNRQLSITGRHIYLS